MKKLFKRIPIISGLSNCSAGDHWEALQEVLITVIFATIPIWLIFFIISLTRQEADPDLFTNLSGHVNNGELFIYSVSIIAPVMYIALKDPPGAKEFPSRLSHIIIIFVVAILSSAGFAVQKSILLSNTKFAIDVSLTLFSISIFILYIATVYKHMRLLGPDDFKKMESNFSEQYKKHR
jgi:hypothetical protein